MIRILASLALIAFAPAPLALGAEFAALRAAARDHGETIWPGFGAAPFGLLLVEPGQETLLCHPSVPPGFTAMADDPATGCARLVRPRSGLPGNWLAAMPLFGPPSTIVVGTPEATGLALPRWRSTVFHEHFHQWQSALPEHYARVAALDLADGDESGMWMLNFAFPYAEPVVAAAQGAASQALAEALAARGTPDFRARLAAYLTLRRALAQAAGERNWRYFDFQLWQEGVARWTEIAIARLMADPAMRADSLAYEQSILAELARPDLPGMQRVAVYAMGAGEAMLLEACGPGWRARYPDVLALGPLLEEAGRTCA